MKEGTIMNTVLIKDLYSDLTPFGNHKITDAGRIRCVRGLRNIGSMVINDGAGFNRLQIFMEAEIDWYN